MVKMKLSHITIITLLCVNVWAQDVPQKRIYEEAQKSYNTGDFKTAYGMFEELSLANPQSAEYNFFLGRCALELKQYDQALTAFDRVLMLNPTHTRTHMELARLHFETAHFEQAQAELDSVLKENIPTNVRDIALAFKTRINELATRHTFNGALIVGGGYDSNANNDIGHKEFIIPAFNIPITGNNKVSDSNVFATMVLNHTYDFGERKGWTLENSFVAYDKLNTKLSNNNLTLFSLNTAPVWSEGSYRFSFPISYDRVYLDGKGYLYNLSASAKASYLIDATSQIEGGYTYKRGYYDSDETQDVTANTVFASYKKAIGEDPIMLSLNTSYTSNAEVNKGRTDVASTGYSYGIELAKSFKNGLRTSMSYSGSSTDYDATDVLFGTKRADTRDEYEWGMGYSIRKDLLINVTLTYAKNNSNHDPFNYDKITALLNAVYTF